MLATSYPDDRAVGFARGRMQRDFHHGLLTVDQTGRIDTTSAKVHALNLPTDGTLITQSFRAAPGGTGALCVLVDTTSDQERHLLLQVHADDSGIWGEIVGHPARSHDADVVGHTCGRLCAR